jgi:effector-binding domain-containing protein/uncharacterized protein YndB with AHSA1/START domain
MNPLRIFQGLLLGLLVLILGAVAIGFALPSQARIERRVLIERPPATVFTVLDGYRHFAAWSPWAELDPGMSTRIEGPVSGVGARYAWASTQPGVGSGSQQIIASVPYERIDVRLEFSGMDSDNRARFDLRPAAQGTELVWSLESTFGNDLVGRYFGLLLDRMIGPDYERGLARLAAHVERLPATDFAGLVVERAEVEARPILYLSGRSTLEPQTIARAYERAYARLQAAMEREGIAAAGGVIAIGRNWDAQRGIYEFDAAIPVPPGTAVPRFDRDLRLGQTYAGTVLKTVHRGSHDQLGAHLQKLMAYKQAVGYESNGAPWDVYSGAGAGAAGGVTETFVPVK